MQFISNTLSSIPYNCFSNSLIGNFDGKSVSVLNSIHFKNVVQWQMTENSRRMVETALGIVAISAVYLLGIFVIVMCAQPFFSDECRGFISPAFECEAAKKELVDKGFPDLNFKEGVSAKIYLVFKHKGHKYLYGSPLLHQNSNLVETTIIPVIDQQSTDDQIRKQFIMAIDKLCLNLEEKILLKRGNPIQVKIGVLLKDKTITSEGSLFSNVFVDCEKICGAGKVSNIYVKGNSKIVINEETQNAFCQLMDIPSTLQFDQEGNFI